jgi:hypothetical protein
MLRSPATIGLILTAKSIARYPEFNPNSEVGSRRSSRIT